MKMERMQMLVNERKKKNSERSLRYYYNHHEEVLDKMRDRCKERKMQLARRRFETGALSYGSLSGKPQGREAEIARLKAICVALGTVKP